MFPLTTEKSIAFVERENALAFAIDAKENKTSVKQELEKKYGEKIKSIRVINTPKGGRKVIASFVKKGAAEALASKLKII
jgi:large subunit ribosomal protein L23